jgi:hypothetical protein
MKRIERKRSRKKPIAESKYKKIRDMNQENSNEKREPMMETMPKTAKTKHNRRNRSGHIIANDTKMQRENTIHVK